MSPAINSGRRISWPADRFFVFLFAAALFCLTGCLSESDSIAVDVSPRGWSTREDMIYANNDTLALRTPTLFMRHDHRTVSGKYIVELRAPSGEKTLRDTVVIELAERFPPRLAVSESPRWPDDKRVRLAEKGDYVFTVTPLQMTRGVWSVGIDLDK